MNAWYLDHSTLVGSPGDLADALNIIERFGTSVGLHLNRGKSVFFIPSESDPSQSPLPSDIPVTHQGFCLLGCPISPPSYCEEVLWDRTAKVKSSLRAVHDLGDAQLETTPLCSCFALPKFSYILHTCPPIYIGQAAKDFGIVMRESLESILGGPWRKASLPSSCGRINLCSASLYAPAAYLGSILLSQPLVEMMLDCAPGSSPHTSSTLALLAIAAVRPHWQCLMMLMFLCTSAHSLLPSTMLQIITSSRQLPLPAFAHWFYPLGCLRPETG